MNTIMCEQSGFTLVEDDVSPNQEVSQEKWVDESEIRVIREMKDFQNGFVPGCRDDAAISRGAQEEDDNTTVDDVRWKKFLEHQFVMSLVDGRQHYDQSEDDGLDSYLVYDRNVKSEWVGESFPLESFLMTWNFLCALAVIFVTFLFMTVLISLELSTNQVWVKDLRFSWASDLHGARPSWTSENASKIGLLRDSCPIRFPESYANVTSEYFTLHFAEMTSASGWFLDVGKDDLQQVFRLLSVDALNQDGHVQNQLKPPGCWHCYGDSTSNFAFPSTEYLEAHNQRRLEFSLMPSTADLCVNLVLNTIFLVLFPVVFWFRKQGKVFVLMRALEAASTAAAALAASVLLFLIVTKSGEIDGGWARVLFFNGLLALTLSVPSLHRAYQHMLWIGGVGGLVGLAFSSPFRQTSGQRSFFAIEESVLCAALIASGWYLCWYRRNILTLAVAEAGNCCKRFDAALERVEAEDAGLPELRDFVCKLEAENDGDIYHKMRVLEQGDLVCEQFVSKDSLGDLKPTLDQLFLQAAVCSILMRSVIEELGSQTGALRPRSRGREGLDRVRPPHHPDNCELAWTSLKHPNKVVSKAKLLYNGDITRVMDLVRETLIFDDSRQLHAFLAALRAHAGVQLDLVRGNFAPAPMKWTPRDCICFCTGLRGVILNLRFVSPRAQQLCVDQHSCELVLVLRGIATCMSAEERACRGRLRVLVSESSDWAARLRKALCKALRPLRSRWHGEPEGAPPDPEPRTVPGSAARARVSAASSQYFVSSPVPKSTPIHPSASDVSVPRLAAAPRVAKRARTMPAGMSIAMPPRGLWGLAPRTSGQRFPPVPSQESSRLSSSEPSRLSSSELEPEDDDDVAPPSPQPTTTSSSSPRLSKRVRLPDVRPYRRAPLELSAAQAAATTQCAASEASMEADEQSQPESSSSSESEDAAVTSAVGGIMACAGADESTMTPDRARSLPALRLPSAIPAHMREKKTLSWAGSGIERERVPAVVNAQQLLLQRAPTQPEAALHKSGRSFNGGKRGSQCSEAASDTRVSWTGLPQSTSSSGRRTSMARVGQGFKRAFSSILGAHDGREEDDDDSDSEEGGWMAGQAAVLGLGFLEAAWRMRVAAERIKHAGSRSLHMAIAKTGDLSVLSTSRGIEAALSKRFLPCACAVLCLVAVSISVASWQRNRGVGRSEASALRFRAHALRGGGDPAAAALSVARVGLMQGGCMLDVWDEALAVEQTSAGIELQLARHTTFDGFFFVTATEAAPALDPVAFTLEARGRGGEWAVVGASKRVLTTDDELLFQPKPGVGVPEQRGALVSVDLRLRPVEMAKLYTNVGLVVLTGALCAAAFFQHPWLGKRIIVACGVATAGVRVLAGLHVLLTDNGQPVFHLLIAANLAVLIALFGLYKEKYILEYLAWLAPFGVLVALGESYMVRGSLEQARMPASALALGLTAMLGVMGNWMLRRRARRLVRSDLEEYSALWDSLLADEAEEEGLGLICEAVCQIEPVCAQGSLRQLKYRLPEEATDATSRPVQNKYNDIRDVFYSHNGLDDIQFVDRSAPASPLRSAPPSPFESAGSGISRVPPLAAAAGTPMSASSLGSALTRNNSWSLSTRQAFLLRTRLGPGEGSSLSSPSLGPRASWPRRGSRVDSPGLLGHGRPRRGSRENLQPWRRLHSYGGLVSNIDTLFVTAMGVQPILNAKVETWGRDTEGLCMRRDGGFERWKDVLPVEQASRAHLKRGTIKKSQRVLEKLNRAYRNDVSKLLDVCRDTLVFEHTWQLAHCINTIRLDPEVEIVGVKNRLVPKYDATTTIGYRDVALILRLKTESTERLKLDLHLCELQLLLLSFAERKSNEGHARYVQFRDAKGE